MKREARASAARLVDVNAGFAGGDAAVERVAALLAEGDADEPR
ncbi:hypothetical protein [Parazoarcus communis]|nr:hypothetical protein [Parazoarcus communis]